MDKKIYLAPVIVSLLAESDEPFCGSNVYDYGVITGFEWEDDDTNA